MNKQYLDSWNSWLSQIWRLEIDHPEQKQDIRQAYRILNDVIKENAEQESPQADYT